MDIHCRYRLQVLEWKKKKNFVTGFVSWLLPWLVQFFYCICWGSCFLHSPQNAITLFHFISKFQYGLIFHLIVIIVCLQVWAIFAAYYFIPICSDLSFDFSTLWFLSSIALLGKPNLQFYPYHLSYGAVEYHNRENPYCLGRVAQYTRG